MATTKVSGELVDLNEATSESGLKIPSGTELNRPTAAAGQIRNNTNETSEGSASCEEYYNGTAWQKINNVAFPPPLAFKTLTYSGNGSTQSITGLGFQPDLVWIKDRSDAYGNFIFDSTRGTLNRLESNATYAAANVSDTLTSFDSDGFSTGNSFYTNKTGDNFVAWCFKANGGTTSSNTDGTITSTVQANTDAGFSIVQYTGTFSAATVGHGLSSAPELVIVKNLASATAAWRVWQANIGGGDKYLSLNETSAVGTASSVWNGNVPTSTVFSVANDSGSNGSGNDMIAYCFHSVDGFSKIGSYSGTGVNGNNITVGFQPNWLMVKRTNAADNWVIVDSERGTDNSLFPDLSSNELSNSGAVTFTSTGFTVNGASGGWNNGSSTYLYMALKTN